MRSWVEWARHDLPWAWALHTFVTLRWSFGEEADGWPVTRFGAPLPVYGWCGVSSLSWDVDVAAWGINVLCWSFLVLWARRGWARGEERGGWRWWVRGAALEGVVVLGALLGAVVVLLGAGGLLQPGGVWRLVEVFGAPTRVAPCLVVPLPQTGDPDVIWPPATSGYWTSSPSAPTSMGPMNSGMGSSSEGVPVVPPAPVKEVWTE